MDTDPIILKEWSYTGLSGTIYHPYFENSRWRLTGAGEFSLDEIALLCEMGPDEAVFLKLKYGG